jgi:hypothetical protein
MRKQVVSCVLLVPSGLLCSVGTSKSQSIPRDIYIYLFRTLVFFWAAGAIVLSVFSIYSCEFFSYRALDGEPWEGLSPPFDDLAKASVGLFRYSETTNSAGIVGEECIDYEDWKDVGQRSYFIVAQSCSMAAPAIAFLALVQILFECCLCRLRGSYICIRFFFFVAGLLQGCSFFIFAETQFW